MDNIECPTRYMLNDQGECVYYLLPPSFLTIIGTILVPLISGLASLAGLGGGGPAIVVFIMFFNYLPKDANIVVFPSILGATLGNCFSNMTKSHNGKPIIQYRYAFLVLPIIFIGSYFGVFLNNFLPSIVVSGIIVFQSAAALPKIKNRFIESYEKQTKEILLHKEKNINQQELITEETVNPFKDQNNLFIFKNVIILMAVFTLLLMLRGTQKIPSVIGIQRCSFMYWFMLFISLGVIGFLGYMNFNTWKSWQNSKDTQLKNVKQVSANLKQSGEISQNMSLANIDSNFNEIIYNGIKSGIFSGFGLGGGLFLVPLFRGFGCNPLEATATTTFIIVVTSGINCVQGFLLGVIRVEDFFYFLITTGVGSYIIAVAVSGYLRKINRLSYVEYLLYIILILAVINLPVSLLLKYINSGYQASLIFSFGNLC